MTAINEPLRPLSLGKILDRTALLQTLITPIYITALVLFYYDQRIRTKSYDIEWMMAQARLTAAQIPAGAASPSIVLTDTVRGS